MMKKNLPFISTALIFLYSATLLLSGKSYSYIALFLCVISLFLLPILLKQKLPSDFPRISVSLVLYFLITALSLFMLGGKLSNLDIPSRTIFIIPAFIFLLNFPPKKEWVFWGILAGSFISGIIAVYHYFFLHIRAFSEFGYMVIQSGNMAMSLSVFSLIIAIHYIKEKKYLLMSLALGCAFSGFLASLLSGARGGWLIAPIVLLTILVVNRRLITKKTALFLTIIMFSSAFISHNIVEQRIQQIVQNLTQFSEKGNSNTSIGARLEMWKSGIYTFIEHPIMGIGYQDRQEYKQSLVDRKLVAPVVLKFTRLHSSYFEELSVKGMLGFITLMIFFIFPLYLFLRKGSIKEDVFAQLGAAHIVLVMGYCLTQNYINHHSGMLHYLMYTVIFYTLFYSSRTIEKDKAEERDK